MKMPCPESIADADCGLRLSPSAASVASKFKVHAPFHCKFANEGRFRRAKFLPHDFKHMHERRMRRLLGRRRE